MHVVCGCGSASFMRTLNTGVLSESHLAALTFMLDQAICYNEEEYRGIEQLRREMEEEEAAAGKKAVEEDEGPVSDACQMCHGSGDGDQLLSCAYCGLEYHMFCLNPPLTRMPRSGWVCPKCAPKKGKRGSKAAAAAAVVVTRDGASTRQSSRQEIAAVRYCFVCYQTAFDA
jgi:hypothetical protein